MKKLLLAPLLCFCAVAFGQSFAVKGTVTDEKTHQPIKRAMVRKVGSDGSDDAVRTDSSGVYFFDSIYIKPNTSYIISADASDHDYCASATKANISTVGLNGTMVFTADFQLNKGCIIVDRFFPYCQFYYGKTDAIGSLPDSLNYIVKLLNDNPTIVLEADGHASPDEKNALKLSQARANACRNYFISHGIDSARIVAKGWGNTKPLPGYSAEDIVKMKTKAEKEAANTANRRVEFRVLSFLYKPKEEGKK